MKRTLLNVLAAVATFFVLGEISFAQDRKPVSPIAGAYVISAKAGGINFVSGTVSIQGKKAKKILAVQNDSLAIGEKISTAADGKAEILLNPGSYVRLAESSEFEFADTALDNLAVKLNRGSAIFEVIADDEFKVAVNTPKSQFSLVKTGVYRVDALSDGTGRISVWKGKAKTGATESAAIKSGKAATIINGQLAIEKFDRDAKGELETWSKQRAKEIAKVNAKLLNREMNNALLSSFSQNRWNVYDSFGLWVRDPFSRSYCFLPFGSGWTSPYGYWFNRDIWSYRLPQTVFYLPNNTSVMNQNGLPRQPQQQPVTPPYERIQTNPGNVVTPQSPNTEPSELPSAPARAPRRINSKTTAPQPIID